MEQNSRRKVWNSWNSKRIGRIVDQIKGKGRKGSGALTGGISGEGGAAQASMGSASVSRNDDAVVSATAPEEGPGQTTSSSFGVEAVSSSSAQEAVRPRITARSDEAVSEHVSFQLPADFDGPKSDASKEPAVAPTIAERSIDSAEDVGPSLMTDFQRDGSQKGKGGENEPSDELAVPPTISLRLVRQKLGRETARDIAVLLKQTNSFGLPLDKNLRCKSGSGTDLHDKTPSLLLSGTLNEKYQGSLSPEQKRHFPGATALFMQALEKDEQGVVRRICFTPVYEEGPTSVLRTSPSASISEVTETEAFPDAGSPHGTSAKSLSGAPVEPTSLKPIVSDSKSSELDSGSEPGRVAGGETLESTKERAGSELLEARRIKQEIVDISGDSKSREIWVTSALHWFKKRTFDLPEYGFSSYFETTAESVIESWGRTLNAISDLTTRDEDDNSRMYPILIGGKERWRKELGG
jgi:hypothetical protein